MKKLWMVARKELRMTATRTYLIATAIGPLVVIALIVLPVLLVRNQVASSLDGRVLAVVAAESMVPAVRAEFTPLGVTVEKADEESGLADRVRAGELDGYVVFPADGIGTDIRGTSPAPPSTRGEGRCPTRSEERSCGGDSSLRGWMTNESVI